MAVKLPYNVTPFIKGAGGEPMWRVFQDKSHNFETDAEAMVHANELAKTFYMVQIIYTKFKTKPGVKKWVKGNPNCDLK